MRAKGFGQAYIDCYRTVSAFYTMRQPLVIILCGAPCTGKSTMAQQLAARLNMPNVMQTDVICEPPWLRTLSPEQLQQLLLGSGEVDMAHASDGGSVLASAPGSGVVLTPSGSQARAVAGGPLGSEGTEATSCGPYGGDGCTAANGAVDAWLLSQFREECRVVRRALEGDFNKALSDGKPLIVEGVHLDPEQLLGELQERGIVLLPFEPQPTTPSGLATPGGDLVGGSSSIAEQGPFFDALPRGVDGASLVAFPGSQQLGVEAVAEPSPAGTSSLLAEGDCVDGSSGKLFAPHGQQASPERHGMHGGVAAGLVAMGRAAASSHGGSSTRTSLAGGHGGDGDEARDDESDVNNYGDADTEGGSGSVSPDRSGRCVGNSGRALRQLDAES
eukprot:XP_001693364.1 predicted protein [Chlamydomonas reinhardtii]